MLMFLGFPSKELQQQSGIFVLTNFDSTTWIFMGVCGVDFTNAYVHGILTRQNGFL
tara:strand:- start:45 stop:212 length:168 start_codon:yes stop_codon:yes gene_type:complete